MGKKAIEEQKQRLEKKKSSNLLDDLEKLEIETEIPVKKAANKCRQAAAYSNIGINKIEELLKKPECDFVLYVGNEKLVKRKEFEQYISKSLEIQGGVRAENSI